MERGEGILGLSRGFFFAGARSVVSTLWKIGDRATALFMRQFYSSLSRGEDKAQALRSAKLRLLNSEFSHPFYWAPFGLQGECFARLDLSGAATQVPGDKAGSR
jgi:CHAT domain-containing protein